MCCVPTPSLKFRIVAFHKTAPSCAHKVRPLSLLPVLLRFTLIAAVVNISLTTTFGWFCYFDWFGFPLKTKKASNCRKDALLFIVSAASKYCPKPDPLMKHIASICAAAGQTQILASKGKNHIQSLAKLYICKLKPRLSNTSGKYRHGCLIAYSVSRLTN